VGLINKTPVHPREVFAEAITDRASAIIIAHNHPSGTVEPGKEDLEITRQLKSAGKILGIRLLDHIIFNRNGYYSFLEKSEL
jgi:DNA repair protein RadC